MTIDFDNLEDSLFNLFDQVKVLISQETWENILLNCTKNEMFVLMLMYRNSEVNMSQIADYLGVPLNTATGIVTRMENKGMVTRIRSQEDKRVVLLVLTEAGKGQVKSMVESELFYGQKVLAALTPEEVTLLAKVFDKVIHILQEEKKPEGSKASQVRKITIT